MKRHIFQIPLVVTAIFASACASSQTVATSQRSPHFERVNNHLQLGGPIYSFVDIEGDLERLIDLISNSIQALPKDRDTDRLKSLDLQKYLKILGLDGLQAVGFSSIRREKGFHNRSVLSFRPPPRGLFQTRKAHTFSVPRMGPANADFVFEIDINLRNAIDVIEKIVASVDPAAGREWHREINKKIPQATITWKQLIAHLDTRVFGIVRINSNRRLQVPDIPIPLPHVEFVLGFDGAADLLNKVPLLQQMPTVQEGPLRIVSAPMRPPGDLSIYNIAVAADTKIKRLYFTTTKTFLNECLNADGRLTKQSHFKQAVTNLPTTGNSFFYMSPNVQNEMNILVTQAIHFTPNLKKLAPLIRAYLSLIAPDAGVPIAGVSMTKKDGVYAVSNMTSSHKMSLLSMNLSGIYAVLFIVGIFGVYAA